MSFRLFVRGYGQRRLMTLSMQTPPIGCILRECTLHEVLRSCSRLLRGTTVSHNKDPARHEEVGRVREPHVVLPRGSCLSPLQRGQMRESGRSVRIRAYWLAKANPNQG